jgi:DNA-binding transcriptional LysR family regulator
VTDAGREMLSAVDSINVAIQACRERLDALKGVAGGPVAIGVVSTAKYFAPQTIAGFSRAHPAVEISLLVGNRAETIGSLRAYDLNLAIMGRPPHDFAV